LLRNIGIFFATFTKIDKDKVEILKLRKQKSSPARVDFAFERIGRIATTPERNATIRLARSNKV
jgi:hypothetical protein